MKLNSQMFLTLLLLISMFLLILIYDYIFNNKNLITPNFFTNLTVIFSSIIFVIISYILKKKLLKNKKNIQN